MSPGFQGQQHREDCYRVCAPWGDFGGASGVQSALRGTVEGFLCQCTTGSRLNFSPLPRRKSLSSRYALGSTQEHCDLQQIPALLLQYLNEFEHRLTMQRRMIVLVGESEESPSVRAGRISSFDNVQQELCLPHAQPLPSPVESWVTQSLSPLYWDKLWG